MLIDLSKQLICVDANDNMLCFFNSANANGRVGHSFEQEKRSNTLLVAKNGVLKVYDAFRYNFRGTEFLAQKHIGGRYFAMNGEMDLGPDQILDNREIVGLTSLGWLNELFQQTYNRTESMTSPAMTAPSGNYFSPTTFSMNYKDVAFAHSIADVFADFMNKNFNTNYSRQDIMQDVISVIGYAEMPWLKEYFPEMKSFEKQNSSYYLDEMPSRHKDMPFVYHYKAKTLNETISAFEKDNKVKLNKPLKKLIFANIAKHEFREETILKSHAKFSNVRLKYKCEDVVEQADRKDSPLHMVTRYRKRVFNEEILDVIHFLMMVFPVDSVHNILTRWFEFTGKIHRLPRRNTDHKEIAEFLNMFSKDKALRLIEEEMGFDKEKDTDRLTNVHGQTGHLADTVRMYNDYNDPDTIPKKLKSKYPKGLQVNFSFQTLKELHDKIAKMHNEIKMCADNKDIVYSDIISELDGLEKDGIRLELPKDTATITLWGKTLSHCIASYADRAHKKQIVLMAVFEGDDLKYNIEMSMFDKKYMDSANIQGAITELEAVLANQLPIDHTVLKYSKLMVKQFRGYRNCQPTDEHRKIVDELVASWWLKSLTNSLVPDCTDQTKQSHPLQAQLKAQKLDSCSEEEQSENVPSQVSNGNLQNRNQDQPATQDAG